MDWPVNKDKGIQNLNVANKFVSNVMEMTK